MAYLTLRNINKIYPNGFHAVHDFNLEAERGEFIVFVGPSGCGKSTTLRMIAGLEDISKGEFLINGQLANNLGPREREVAMVFQSYALYPNMTVYDNLAFGLNLQGVDEDVIEQRVQKTAKILGLTDYLDRMPRALSGGQRQRVAVGRSIIRKVGVFLMDEPLSNLDAKLRVQMRTEITKLHQRLQTTFIYVTHDQTEAMTLGDRIVIMKDGFVQQIGTPQEVFGNPCNIFVAGFIGTPQMNFFKAQLEKTAAGYQIKCMGATIPVVEGIAAKLAAKGHAGGEIILGVRPEHITLANDPATAIESTVEVSELMGSEFYLHATVGADKQNVVMRIQTTDLPAEYHGGVPYGTKMNFTFRPQLIHMFDPATEKSLLF